jgi:glycosyltransferase involved in cell wall biosynthesis
MRLGFVIQGLHGGGAEFVAREWIKQIVDADVDVVVYVYNHDTGDSVIPGATVRRFPLRSRWLRLATLAPWLRRRCRIDDVDVIVSMMSFSNLMTLVACCPLRTGRRPCVIVSERNVPTVALELKGATTRLQRAILRRTYSYADGVIAISHPVAADLIGGYGCRPETTFVVPNPSMAQVPGADLLPAPDRTTVPSEAGNPETLELAFVGRLVPQKRPHLFVELLEELKRRGISARGRIIGVGPLDTELGEQARAAGVHCDLLGWREPWQLAAADVRVMVLPSKIEGFGNVFVEAAAVGIPSVACSESLGSADAIIPGVTGILTLTSEVSDLADATLRAADLWPVEAPPGWLRRFSAEESSRLLLQAVRATLVSR